MTPHVLLLCPSRGLGGGIERYVQTVEAALTAHEVRYERLDLLDGVPDSTPRRKLAFAAKVIRAVRRADGPVVLVLAHRNLLSLLPLIRPAGTVADTVVIVHGSELWSGRQRGGRQMGRDDVRVLAASSFSAGALLGRTQAGVLPPGLSATWYDTLVRAAERPYPPRDGVELTTAFRLSEWRGKGLETIVDTLRLLDDPRLHLTVCGSGPVPPDLQTLVDATPRCTLRVGLDDAALAEQFAATDVFVLATRTRTGDDASGEGFGLVLLEAQVAGTPVVAPAYGGSADAFHAGVTGLAPRDESAEALAAVLWPLTTDEHLRAEMGTAAAAWARSGFAPARYARRVVTALIGKAAR